MSKQWTLFYHRYFIEYQKDFDTLEEALEYAESGENDGEISTGYILEPSGRQVDGHPYMDKEKILAYYATHPNPLTRYLKG